MTPSRALIAPPFIARLPTNVLLVMKNESELLRMAPPLRLSFCVNVLRTMVEVVEKPPSFV